MTVTREEVKSHAARFKTSWCELAQALTHVRAGQLYAAWGYPTFESYCDAELELKPATVRRLLAGWDYLKAQAPEVAERAKDPKQPAPSLDQVETAQAVEAAAEAGQMPAAQAADLAEGLLNGHVPAARAKRQVEATRGDDVRAAKARAQLARAAGTLAKRLVAAAAVLPESIRERIERDLKELLTLCADAPDGSKETADVAADGTKHGTPAAAGDGNHAAAPAAVTAARTARRSPRGVAAPTLVEIATDLGRRHAGERCRPLNRDKAEQNNFIKLLGARWTHRTVLEAGSVQSAYEAYLAAFAAAKNAPDPTPKNPARQVDQRKIGAASEALNNWQRAIEMEKGAGTPEEGLDRAARAVGALTEQDLVQLQLRVHTNDFAHLCRAMRVDLDGANFRAELLERCRERAEKGAP
jgi:hypothetical protein